MDERTCDQCGAQNPINAAYCWQCHARWDGSASPSAPVRPGTIRAAPVGAYGGGPGGSVLTAPPPPHVGAPAGRSWGRLLAAAVVFVAGVAGGWWLVDRLFFGGFPFPDEVAGQERVDSEVARDAADVIASIGEILDVDMEMAFYGTDLRPAYVMVAFELPDAGAVTQVPPFGGASAGDFSFQCGPDAQGAACLWEEGGTVVGIGGIGQTPEQLEPVARRVRTDLAG
jgi:hypothetical protein